MWEPFLFLFMPAVFEVTPTHLNPTNRTGGAGVWLLYPAFFQSLSKSSPLSFWIVPVVEKPFDLHLLCRDCAQQSGRM